MSLKEKLAAKRIAKEQRIAEQQLVKAGKTAEALAKEISSNRQPVNLDRVAEAAEQFDPSREDREIMDQLLSKPKNKAMYMAVREYLEGDWMAEFRRLIAVMTPLQRMNAQVLSFADWRSAADQCGIDEKGLTQALQVIVIFREALNKNNGVRKGA